MCFKYIGIEEVPEEKSMLNKFRTSTMSINELVMGDTNSLGVVSMSGYESPGDYSDVSLTIVEDMLRELSMHYKYVLVDLGTSLNSECTIQGILTCNKVYSIVRPISSQISKLLAVKEVIGNIGHINKIYDVFQTMILDNGYSQEDMKDVGLNLVGNIKMDAELMISADNCKYVGSGLKSKESAKYVKLVKQLGEDIKTLVVNSYVISENDIIAGDKNITTTEEELA